MKLVVGLGNPGARYQRTRHNIGFDVVDELTRSLDAPKPKKKFNGEINQANMGGHATILLKPQTYMNRSGTSVQLVRGFYRVEDCQILVICDDFNLPTGRLRFRCRGSAGGQKGLGDIIRCLGTDEVHRLRIGIGSPPDGWDVADYVLSKFKATELPEMEHAKARAGQAVHDWCAHGIEYCMNKYNGAV